MRITVHKTSAFGPEECEGIYGGLTEVPEVELVPLRESGFRLVPALDYPPHRGTLCTVGDQTHYLYTTGFYSDWGTWTSVTASPS